LYVFSYGDQNEDGINERYGVINQTVMDLYEIAYKKGTDSVFSPTVDLNEKGLLCACNPLN
jgi:hypothetical protein